MATLVENANRIKNAKESLRQSFINKGVNIDSSTKLENYSPIVDNLDFLTDMTICKPYESMTELKPYYLRESYYPSSGSSSSKQYRTQLYIPPDYDKFKIIFDDINRCFRYSESSAEVSGYPTFFGQVNTGTRNSTGGTLSHTERYTHKDDNIVYSHYFIGIDKTGLDNFFPQFSGYYVMGVDNQSNKYIATVNFSYEHTETNDTGITNTGKDAQGRQFYNKYTINKLSSSIDTYKYSTHTSVHKIIKLSENYGIIYYANSNDNTDLLGTTYGRLFRVNSDGSIAVMSSFTAVGAESSSTYCRFYPMLSYSSSNQIFFLLEKIAASTNKGTYEFYQQSCNTQYNNTGSGVTIVRTTDSNGAEINVSLGNDTNHNFYYKAINDFGSVIKANSTAVADIRTYFGTNRTNAINTGTIGKTLETLFNEGNYVPIMDYEMTYNGQKGYHSFYIVGKNKDGIFLMKRKSYSGTNFQGTFYGEETFKIKFDMQGTNMFYRVD